MNLKLRHLADDVVDRPDQVVPNTVGVVAVVDHDLPRTKVAELFEPGEKCKAIKASG